VKKEKRKVGKKKWKKKKRLDIWIFIFLPLFFISQFQ